MNNLATNKDYLESWAFSPIEWNTFIKTANSLKKEDNIYMGIAILIAGIPFLMFVRNTGFLMASAFVIPFAFLLPYFRNKIANNTLKATSKDAYVTFYPEFLDVNGKRIELFANKKWIKNMQIIVGNGDLSLLEIDIAWRTRKGDTFDETRVPIPTDKLERAEALIEYYRKYK